MKRAKIKVCSLCCCLFLLLAYVDIFMFIHLNVIVLRPIYKYFSTLLDISTVGTVCVDVNTGSVQVATSKYKKYTIALTHVHIKS